MFDPAKRYPERLTIGVPAELHAALRSVADDARVSVAEAARECIRRGIDPMREAWRKSKRRAAAAAAAPDPEATE